LDNTKRKTDFILIKSRFKKIDNQIFFNWKTKEKVICKYGRNKEYQYLYLFNSNNEKIAYLNFFYQQWMYYIANLKSFKKWNWRFLLDLFLKVAGKKIVYLQDDAYSFLWWIRLNQFYFKSGFKRAKINKLEYNKVLFYWKKIPRSIEQKILYKYF